MCIQNSENSGRYKKCGHLITDNGDDTEKKERKKGTEKTKGLVMRSGAPLMASLLLIIIRSEGRPLVAELSSSCSAFKSSSCCPALEFSPFSSASAQNRASKIQSPYSHTHDSKVLQQSSVRVHSITRSVRPCKTPNLSASFRNIA